MNVYIFYVLLGIGIITFFLAIKPSESIIKFKNLFWIFGNLFLLAGLFYKYYYVEEPSYAGLIMLLYANFEMLRQKRKGTIK